MNNPNILFLVRFLKNLNEGTNLHIKSSEFKQLTLNLRVVFGNENLKIDFLF